MIELSPLLQRELKAAKEMVETGVEPTLKDAIETCIKYGGRLTLGEAEILRAQAHE